VIVRTERTVLDTNVWIFGLRWIPSYPACVQLMHRLGELSVVVPRQILQELQANLNDEELQMLFDLVSRYPKRIVLDWQGPPVELSRKYQSLGWKRGDALVASHIEHLGAPVLVSENTVIQTRKHPGIPGKMQRGILAYLSDSSWGQEVI